MVVKIKCRSILSFVLMVQRTISVDDTELWSLPFGSITLYKRLSVRHPVNEA